jgi:predicted HicB family RNase H-like nuclease
MAKAPAPKEPHKSFTVRIPESLYEEIGDLAIAEGIFINVKVNQLLRLGLNKHVSLDAALTRLIVKEVVSD